MTPILLSREGARRSSSDRSHPALIVRCSLLVWVFISMEKGGLLRRAARPTSRAASYLHHFLLPRVIPGRTAAKQKFSWWYRQAILLVQPQSIIKQINLRLTKEEFLRKHESEFRSAIPDCGKFLQLKIFHLLKQHVASGWCQGLPSVACTHNLLSWLFWQYSSKSPARTMGRHS